ncbi:MULTISPECIES: hypothetical protein [Enterobacterales]|uniref:hypothetical protein n=1 Tax=Enterobacterales TaxID=91347 RepID=UPI002ED7D31C
MNTLLSKNDLNFLVDTMNKPRKLLFSTNLSSNSPLISGEMSIPEPARVDSQGDMDPDVYKKCSTLMSVCVNMVQKSLTDAANIAGIEPSVALKNIDAWVAAFVDFPLPIFTFSETQTMDYKKDDFALSANPDVVESIVNIKNVANLKEAVVKALRQSGEKGNLASYSNQDKKFTYFGLVSGYKSTAIETRIVSFQMNMKNTEVKSLCGGIQKTHLDSHYDTYMFVADSMMMQKLADKMGDKLVEYFAKQLYTFIEQFYEEQLKNYKSTLVNIFKKK